MALENTQGQQIGTSIESHLHSYSQMANELHGTVSSANWRDFDRIVFINTVERGISELLAMHGILEKIQAEIEKQPLQNAPDCAEIKSEFEKTIQLLEKNLEFEQGKKSRAKEINILAKDTHPELYASLQQKVLSLLLKSRYLDERLFIFSRKQSSSPLPEKSTGKQIMELLDRKETELQDLKTKYEGIRKNAFLGLIEEKTVSDLETDVFDLEKTIAMNYSMFEQSMAHAINYMEGIPHSLRDAKEKFSSVKESIEYYSAKNSELNKILKKERDYAKKIVLDIEHETTRLRSDYTKEMLNLQEAKISAKKESEEKLGKKISALRSELDEKDDLLKRFKKIAEEKTEKEKRLEEQVKQLRLLLKVKEKHDSVKSHFKKKAFS